MFGKQIRNQVAQIRWLDFVNGSGQTVPAFAAIQVTGADKSGLLTCAQPVANGCDVLINGPLPVSSGGRGVCTWDTPNWVLYDPNTGTPAQGQAWGAMAGSWLLGKGFAGFICYGGSGTGCQGTGAGSAAGPGCRMFAERNNGVTGVCPVFGMVGGRSVVVGINVQYAGGQCILNPVGCCNSNSPPPVPPPGGGSLCTCSLCTGSVPSSWQIGNVSLTATGPPGVSIGTC